MRRGEKGEDRRACGEGEEGKEGRVRRVRVNTVEGWCFDGGEEVREGK